MCSEIQLNMKLLLQQNEDISPREMNLFVEMLSFKILAFAVCLSRLKRLFRGEMLEMQLRNCKQAFAKCSTHDFSLN